LIIIVYFLDFSNIITFLYFFLEMDKLPKELQRYILTFVATSRDTAITQPYLCSTFRAIIRIIDIRLDIYTTAKHLSTKLDLNPVLIWKSWSRVIPYLNDNYWFNIIVNGEIYLNLNIPENELIFTYLMLLRDNLN